MSETNNVVILGAGVTGCSIAYHLAKKGIKSTIIEKEAIGSRASGKAWAVIVYPPYFFAWEKDPDSFFAMPEGEVLSCWQDLFWSAWYRTEALALDIAEGCNIDIEFGDTPWTLLAASEEEEKGQKALMSSMAASGGHESRWLGSEELRDIFPGINPDIIGGLSFPQLQVEPYKFTLGLGTMAEKMGAVIRNGDVVGFETKADRITAVKLASGTLVPADTVVIAMGPWSGPASSWLDNEVPVLSVMTECLRVNPPEGYPPHSLSGGDGLFVGSRVNGEVILGPPVEIEDPHEYFEKHSRPDFDSSLSEEVKTKTIEAAMALLPDQMEAATVVEHRGDLLAYGPNPFYHKPVMGHLPDWENGYIATRFGATGIQVSVGVGGVMADLIADGHVPFRAKKMMERLSP